MLNTLKNETHLLEDDSRQRVTYSLIMTTAYTLTKKLSVEGLFSWVRQERRIRQNGGFQDFTATSGIGDAILLFRYSYLTTGQWHLTAGLGPKIPLGASDVASDLGITLNADLQPGSGAWDGIFNHRILFSGFGRPSLILSNNIIVRTTGTNDDYLGSQSYQFGNEIQLITGIADQWLLAKQLFNISINTRFRQVEMDKNNQEWLPNTGGSWLFILPALGWLPTPNITISLMSELPLYSRVVGTQLTPNYRFNVGVYYLLNKKEDKNFNFQYHEDN